MGFFDFFKSKKPDSPKEDWTNLFPKEIVDGLLSEIKNNPQACWTDKIPQGIGEFGLEKTNPIPTYGIPENEAYLHSLRTSNGEVLRYRRTGSIEVDNINNSVDEYEIFNFQGETIAFIYISPYHWTTSKKSPIGFYVLGDSKKTARISAPPITVFNQYSAFAEFQEKQKKNEARKYKEQKKRSENYKPDWEKYKIVLTANSIHTLYHFTDRANLKSIKKQGALYSWHYSISNNIDIPVPGGNQLSRDLDKRKGLQDFVRVSFTRSHPMMFVQPIRNRNNVILEIDTEVIYWQGSHYANKNATRNDVNVGSTLHDFNQLRFKLFKLPNHFGLSENDKPYFQGEILVPIKIPAKFIRNLNDLISQDDIH
jgi:hypothetical protein